MSVNSLNTKQLEWSSFSCNEVGLKTIEVRFEVPVGANRPDDVQLSLLAAIQNTFPTLWRAFAEDLQSYDSETFVNPSDQFLGWEIYIPSWSHIHHEPNEKVTPESYFWMISPALGSAAKPTEPRGIIGSFLGIVYQPPVEVHW